MKVWLITPENYEKFPQVTTMYVSDEGLKVQVPRFIAVGCGEWRQQEVRSFHLDGGGSVHLQASRHELDFLGSKLSVLSSHVEFVLGVLEATPQRESGLYQFGGWPAPTFLTATEWQEAIRLLKSILPEAKAIADAENTAFNQSFVDSPKRGIHAARRPVGKVEEA